MLITHNLKAAWRNILKYKVQNTISVLCLSVGVILFAISLYFVNIIWHNYTQQGSDSNRVKCTIRPWGYDKDYLTYNELNEISKLPSVKKLIYRSSTWTISFFSIDDPNSKIPRGYSICGHLGTDQEDDYYTTSSSAPATKEFIPCITVSSEWLADKNFYSAITGNKIGPLCPGNIVLDKVLSEQLFGKDVNPIGRNLGIRDKNFTICDVVYSPTYIEQRGKMYWVAKDDAPVEFHEHYIEYVIKDGYTQKHLIHDLEHIYRTSKVKCFEIVADKWYSLAIILLMIVLGISVLVIGISGYLKMQLQLFFLRSREMALRRCNGAKPLQLFMLLCTELFIIFCSITIVSILLSLGFSEYVMPIIRKFGITESLDICPEIIYVTELKIILVTFLCAIVIAWLIVRKVLNNPLSITIGKNFSQRTVWNRTMQITQYLATTILFFFIALAFVKMNEIKASDNYRVNPQYFKNVLEVRAVGLEKEVAQLPSVEKEALWGRYARQPLKSRDKTDRTLVTSLESDNDSTYKYQWFVTDPEYFQIFKKRIVEKQTHNGDSAMDIPVFTCLENVDSIKNILSLKYSTSNELHTLPDGKQYVLIGFTSSGNFRYGVGYMGRFYIIKDRNKYIAESKYGELYLAEKHYILPKNNDTKKFNAEYNVLWHKKNPDAPSDMEISIPSVYDNEFKKLMLAEFVTELIYILVIVCLISIILTVYSTISLETRGKQKEVAIRKINGAKTHDIMMLFGKYYIVTLGIAFGIAILIYVVAYTIFHKTSTTGEIMTEIIAILVSMATITLVTLLTVWQKIYKISHINPALLIKKE